MLYAHSATGGEEPRMGLFCSGINISPEFKRGAAPGAYQRIILCSTKLLLERGFDCVVETVAAQLMRFLQASHGIVWKVSENTIGYLFPGVSLLFCAPIFQAHAFLFKFLYFRRQRKMRLLLGDD